MSKYNDNEYELGGKIADLCGRLRVVNDSLVDAKRDRREKAITVELLESLVLDSRLPKKDVKALKKELNSHRKERDELGSIVIKIDAQRKVIIETMDKYSFQLKLLKATKTL